MTLFPGEDYLVRSNNDRVILTTHRIQLTSLFIALLIGIFLLVFGLMWSQQGEVTTFNAATIAGVLAILVYFLSRRHVVSITPNGGKSLNFETGPMSDEEINEFIDKVQLAKAVRRKE